MPTGADWNKYDRYLVVVAHPDDAEFSSAGTIALLTAAGKHVVIAQVTSGDKGTSDPNTATTHMVSTREAEEIEAGRVLGVEIVDFLRQTDGELLPTLELRGQIARVIRKHTPDVVITHDPVPTVRVSSRPSCGRAFGARRGLPVGPRSARVSRATGRRIATAQDGRGLVFQRGASGSDSRHNTGYGREDRLASCALFASRGER